MNRKFLRIVRWGYGTVLAGCLASGITIASAQAQTPQNYGPARAGSPAATAGIPLLQARLGQPTEGGPSTDEPPTTNNGPADTQNSAAPNTLFPSTNGQTPNINSDPLGPGNDAWPKPNGSGPAGLGANPAQPPQRNGYYGLPGSRTGQSVYGQSSGNPYYRYPTQGQKNVIEPAPRRGLFNGGLIQRISNFFSPRSTTSQQVRPTPQMTHSLYAPNSDKGTMNWLSNFQNNITGPQEVPVTESPRSQRIFPLFRNIRRPGTHALQGAIQHACGRSVRVTNVHPNQKGELEIHLQGNQQDVDAAMGRILSLPQMSHYTPQFYIDQ